MSGMLANVRKKTNVWTILAKMCSWSHNQNKNCSGAKTIKSNYL